LKEPTHPQMKRWIYARDMRQNYWDRYARKGYDYYNGTGHWTFEEQQLLWKQERAPYRLNFIFKWMNVVSGNERQNRNEIWLYPMEGGDVRMAAVYNYILKYIKKENNLDWRLSQSVLDGYLTGYGWLKNSVAFDEDGELVIIIKQKNPLLMYEDPDCIEYDLSDAKDIFESSWLKKDDLIKQYPKLGKDINAWFKDAPAENDLYINRDKELCRVVDSYKRETTYKKKYFDKNDGKIYNKEGKNRVAFNAPIPIIKMERLFGDVVLEEIENPFGLNDFPHTKVCPFFTKGQAVALVDQVSDIQDIINKSFLQLMDILNRQPKKGGLVEEGAVDEEMLEALRTGEWKIVPPGTISGNKILPFDVPVYPHAHAEVLNNAVEYGKYIIGITDVWEGEAPGRVESALGLQLLRQQSVLSFEQAADNIRMSQILVGRKTLKQINEYWSLDKTLRLLGEEGDLIQLEITPEEIRKGQIDKNTNELMEESIENFPNILNKGKYDFTVDLNQPSVTVRHWNMYLALEIAKMINEPITQSRAIAKIIDMTDFPRKDEWKQIIEEAAQMGALVSGQQIDQLGQAIAQTPSKQQGGQIV
jgi:hypothetical protein